MWKTKFKNIGVLLCITLAIWLGMLVLLGDTSVSITDEHIMTSKASFTSTLDSLCLKKEEALRTQLNESEDIMLVAQQITNLKEVGGCEKLGIEILEERLKAKGEV
jgi:hypothetical protein|tara:strand:+ start:4056 stop:4373 length:318 start_codon:yes stop_codon:yes gene_type:complete